MAFRAVRFSISANFERTQHFQVTRILLALDLFKPLCLLFPARIVGSAIGIAAFAGNLAGMAMIQLAGWSLYDGLGYAPLLFICGGSYCVALALTQILVPRIEIAEPGAAAMPIGAH